MKNAKRISELLQTLQSTDEQWGLMILDRRRAQGEEIHARINQLLSILRQELKTEDAEAVCEYLRHMRVQEEVAEKLVEEAEDMLWIYEKLSLLRELEDRDEAALRGLLSTVYQKYIIRFEPGYLNSVSGGKYDGEVLRQLSACMANLTDYYIIRNYSLRGMVKDLEDESGLSKENCEYWADLIEQNYLSLKMNYIVSELGRINDRLRK